VNYAGPAPSSPGIDQINFAIAPGTPNGCYVPLTVKYGSQMLTSFLSKTADGSPCPHPLHLSLDDMKALDRGDPISVGQISVASNLVAATSGHASRQESVSVTLLNLWGAEQVAAYSMQANPAPGCVLAAAPVAMVSGAFGALAPASGGTPLQTMALSSGGRTVPLFSSHIFGPNRADSNLPASPDAPLPKVPPPVLGAGQWTWSEPQPYGVVNFSFALPAPIQLHTVPGTLARGVDSTFTWNGVDFDTNTNVRLTIAGVAQQPQVACNAPASAGAITVPRALLDQLGATAATVSATTSEPGPAAPSGKAAYLMVVTPTSSDSRPVDVL
jgi:hypothetical protein